MRVPAGYGKVAVVEKLRTALTMSQHRIVYVGDGSSDVHVMLHVNRLGRTDHRGLREYLYQPDRAAHGAL